MFLFKLINFYLILLLSYFSIAGYGSRLIRIFKKSTHKSVSESFFYGLILILPICILKISIFNTHVGISIFLFLIGIFFFTILSLKNFI